jgi:hypothetical protein
VLLGVEPALDAVERVLGGRHAGGARALSLPECGLLGYGIARLFSALDPGLVLDHAESVSACGDGAAGQVLVQGTLSGGFGTLPLRALLSPALAARLGPFTLRACVSDAPAPEVLSQLSPGDVLVSDAFLLTSTTRGPVGPVRLEAEGLRVGGRLEAGRVWSVPSPEQARTGELEIVLTERTVDMRTLALVRAGHEPAFRDVALRTVELRHEGRRLGAGELVSYRGAVGVRVTECGSASSLAHPPA